MKTESVVRFEDLSVLWKELVRKMQESPFAVICNLKFVGGEPVWDETVDAVEVIHLDGVNGPREEVALETFELRGRVVTLIEILRQRDVGLIRCLDVKHGLPFTVKLEMK